jgi:glutamate synthase domain-containing protein 2/glutamate synthase domain-containing protein 1/glutamate synthase domain-containing protein 3
MRRRRVTEEHSACGVGFVASTTGQASRSHLDQALKALACVEHRGGCLADGKTGDGAGIMTEVPFALFGLEKGEVAVATLFLMAPPSKRAHALSVFESTFAFLGLEVIGQRDVPVDTSVLGRQARETLPTIVHAFIKRPAFCRSIGSFDTALYHAKQSLRTQMRRAGYQSQLYCTSLSTTTIIYKALTRSEDLERFYPDLRDSGFKTRFALFHRRFSTNTSTSWDKAQPFRMIAHNGEINTIACNRAWSYSREQALGIPKDELLTHEGISDSGSLNEMVEALRYRSSIPSLDECLAIMIPPADKADEPFYKFWSRAVEPWDGPAFLSFSDGTVVGARLDRNGFRPCRWARTRDAFYLASEAGLFDVDEGEIINKGTIHGGSGCHVVLDTGEVSFADPTRSRQNQDATFDPRLEPIGRLPVTAEDRHPDHRALFRWCKEDVEAVLRPMMESGKEPIGSMGDTARPAIFSELPRSFFDFFYQTFAQVTNPPLDHLRERMVTDLRTYLGGRPNVFAPKELIPVKPGIELLTPILDLEQMAYVTRAAEKSKNGRSFETASFSTTFARVRGPEGLREALDTLSERVLAAIRGGCSILILTDRLAKYERPPIPSLLALRAADHVLTQWGNRLDVSIVVDSADVRSTHQVAALISFGAAAVCPYLAFELCDGDERMQENLRAAFEAGLLKVMSKMGISSVRGYQSSRLFTAYGLSQRLLDQFFPGLSSPIGGYELEDLGEMILRETEQVSANLVPLYSLREHNKGTAGEKHSMTSALAKLVHEHDYDQYGELARSSHPVSPRHLLSFKAQASIAIEDVQPADEILRRFGSGAMSFGAISAEAQRDLIRAMEQIGGRSASGEGGENPYYFVDGTTATSKQVASARFGVTAEYLVTAKEIEIKIAQGAKPGEGGQLMAVKVDEHIAKARHASPGVDLISPAPLHDIYSIEDLRELIYELKQLEPDARVSVKLVSGVSIGAIAAGVVKAGADVIHIAGGDGGTGAASLSSMKHAGLPWELGLVEVHRTLVEQRLREHVVLRVDGGLSTGTDVVMAAMLGAEEFGFGKLLLVAEGCIMARVCEKNTCPRGIATHDPKYKAKYRGSPEEVVEFLRWLAEDVRVILARLGVDRLETIVGRADLLEADPRRAELIRTRRLDLSELLEAHPHDRASRGSILREGVSRLNARITEDVLRAIERRDRLLAAYRIKSTDRAVLATASGELAKRTHDKRMGKSADLLLPPGTIQIEMIGSAGQGFGVFLVEGFDITLRGEANDSVVKSMSGGRVVIAPHPAATFAPEESSIVGNCALYGATGGKLFVHGRAGDRFAVRNSGAIAVVEGTGLHACEYMTNGIVVILGSASHNIGAGMTGGELFLRREFARHLNSEYVVARAIDDADLDRLMPLLDEYRALTGSRTVPVTRDSARDLLVHCLPKAWAAVLEGQTRSDIPRALGARS